MTEQHKRSIKDTRTGTQKAMGTDGGIHWVCDDDCPACKEEMNKWMGKTEQHKGEHIRPLVSTKKRNKWVFDKFGKDYYFNTQLLIDYETQVVIPALNERLDRVRPKIDELMRKVVGNSWHTYQREEIIKLLEG